MKDIYLTALELPGNIQKPFYQIQDRLFTDFGLTSARLFPPLIPLRAGKCTDTVRQQLIDAMQEISYFSASSEIHRQRTTFYTPVVTEPAVQIVESGSPASRVVSGLFPEYHPAILLAAAREYTPDLPEGFEQAYAAGLLQDPIRWKTMYLTEIRLQVIDGDRWWKELYWEYTKYSKVSCRG